MKYLLLTISIVNIIVSTKMFNNVSETLSPRRLSLISFFYYYFILFSFIGSILLTYNINSFYMSTSLRYPEISMVKSWISINLVLFLTPIVMLIWKHCLPENGESFLSFTEKKTSLEFSDKRLFNVVLILALLGFIAIIYVFSVIGFDKLPIVNSIRGSSPQELAVLRQLATRGFKGNIYIRNFIAFSIIPILSYIAFVQMLETKAKKWGLMYVFLLTNTVIVLTYDLQKAPIIRYLFTYLILINLFRKPVSLKLFNTAIAGIVSLIFFFYVFVTPTPLHEVFSFNQGPVNRVLKSQVFPTYLHMDVFPEREAFMNGASFPPIISKNVFNTEHKRSGRLVMEIIRPEAVADGTAGVLNTLYVGEAYANFSWVGVLFSITWIASLLYITHYILLKFSKTPITIALYAYLSNLLVNATQGGFVDFLYNPGLLFILTLCVLVTLLSKNSSKKNDCAL